MTGNAISALAFLHIRNRDMLARWWQLAINVVLQMRSGSLFVNPTAWITYLSRLFGLSWLLCLVCSSWNWYIREMASIISDTNKIYKLPGMKMKKSIYKCKKKHFIRPWKYWIEVCCLVAEKIKSIRAHYAGLQDELHENIQPEKLHNHDNVKDQPQKCNCEG